ncbi:MAG TPA: helix-turn-helix domain-containing protein [Candidatus Limnocylindrales bacterium]|nr:helix-turn-helix domain-containing protein [Candidatus Limnocylindrales bacterium]
MRDRLLIVRIGAIVRDLRRAVGWTQRRLASEAGVSQSLVSAIENGHLRNLTVTTLTVVLDAMGSRLIIDATRPFLGDRERQRDVGHIRCVNHVVRRLMAAGWQVATEVEIGAGNARGWIDILAFHPVLRIVLVIEVKPSCTTSARLNDRWRGTSERPGGPRGGSGGSRPAFTQRSSSSRRKPSTAGSVRCVPRWIARFRGGHAISDHSLQVVIRRDRHAGPSRRLTRSAGEHPGSGQPGSTGGGRPLRTPTTWRSWPEHPQIDVIDQEADDDAWPTVENGISSVWISWVASVSDGNLTNGID